MFRISIITVCLNAENTIRSTINSVLSQDYDNIQYIIIDGKSTDKTLNIINQFKDHVSIIVSENDNGLYDAINKGILLSDGDYVGILNADDVFKNNFVVSLIANTFKLNDNIMSLFADVEFVNKNNILKRKYSSKNWKPSLLRFGYMPAHPTFYCRRDLFDRYGLYRTDFRIAADYELLLRFYNLHKISFKYIPNALVVMNLGGISSSGYKSYLIITKEILKSCKLNHIYANFLFINLRFLFKIPQYLFFSKI